MSGLRWARTANNNRYDSHVNIYVDTFETSRRVVWNAMNPWLFWSTNRDVGTCGGQSSSSIVSFFSEALMTVCSASPDIVKEWLRCTMSFESKIHNISLLFVEGGVRAPAAASDPYDTNWIPQSTIFASATAPTTSTRKSMEYLRSTSWAVCNRSPSLHMLCWERQAVHFLFVLDNVVATRDNIASCWFSNKMSSRVWFVLSRTITTLWRSTSWQRTTKNGVIEIARTWRTNTYNNTPKDESPAVCHRLCVK